MVLEYYWSTISTVDVEFYLLKSDIIQLLPFCTDSHSQMGEDSKETAAEVDNLSTSTSSFTTIAEDLPVSCIMVPETFPALCRVNLKPGLAHCVNIR